MIEWKLSVREETDKIARSFLAEKGMQQESDLSTFVDSLVREAILEAKISVIKERNAQYTYEEIQELVDEAVREVRKQKRETCS
jgi:hypothetical protein